jgi:hypothetical protein
MTVIADSAKIAHGKYLALGPAHCAHCHKDINFVHSKPNQNDQNSTIPSIFSSGTRYITNSSSDLIAQHGSDFNRRCYNPLL